MNRYNNAFEVFAASVKGEVQIPEKQYEDICTFTGEKALCVERKELIGKSFCNIDLLKAPRSKSVSVSAYIALKYKWQRMSCWYVNGSSFAKIDRAAIKQKILNAEYDAQWCAFITTSYKKHGVIRTPVNSGDKAIWCLDETLVDCSDNAKVLSWHKRLLSAINSGIGRNVMLTLQPKPFILKMVGAQKWIEFEKWARPKYRSPLYKLMVYIMPTIAELKKTKKEAKEKHESNAAKNNIHTGRNGSGLLPF